MDAYVYQAALLCSDCAIKVMDDLGSAKDTGDSGDFPQGPYAGGGGEADTFQHCDMCRVFLENPLTGEGVEDAIRRFEDYIVARKGYAPDVLKVHLQALGAIPDLCSRESAVVALALRCLEADCAKKEG